MATIKSIEEKAKAYDEAIGKLRRLHDDYDTVSTLIDIKEELEHIFPELKESEDEGIRKALVDALNKNLGNGIEKYGTTLNAALVWLEKQGEPNPYSGTSFEYNGHIWGMCARDNGVDILLDKQLFKHLEKQGEQKPTDEEIKELLRTEYEKGRADAIAEMQKSWSDEDEKVLHAIRNALNYEKPRNYLKSRDFEFTDILDWLKSLKDRMQPQQEKERILGKLEEWLDEYISNLADVGTDTLIGSFRKYLDGKLPVKPKSH